MKTFDLVVTETLQREVEIEAEEESIAIEELEKKYNDGEIVLDYSDLIDTEFSNCKYTKKDIQVLDQISTFCENECSECNCCSEDNCVLYRIEKIIENGYYERPKCCICGEEFEGYGNNAEPVKEGTCCDSCNYAVVIPARLNDLR